MINSYVQIENFEYLYNPNRLVMGNMVYFLDKSKIKQLYLYIRKNFYKSLLFDYEYKIKININGKYEYNIFPVSDDYYFVIFDTCNLGLSSGKQKYFLVDQLENIENLLNNTNE